MSFSELDLAAQGDIWGSFRLLIQQPLRLLDFVFTEEVGKGGVLARCRDDEKPA
jgi:hypothetical protein